MHRLSASHRAAYILSIILVSCLLLLMVSAVTSDRNLTFARCSNGTHKSPSGDCETVTSHAGLPRCPNGFHISPSGICEQFEPSISYGGSGSLNIAPTPPLYAGNSNNNPTPSITRMRSNNSSINMPTQNTSPSPSPSSTSQFTGNAGTDVMPPETFITSVIDGSNSMLMGQGQVQQQTGAVGNASSLSSNPQSNTNATSNSSKMMFTFAGTDNMAISGFECSLDRPLPSPNSVSSALVGAFATNRVFSCSNRVVIDGLVPGTMHIFEVRSVDSSGIRDPSPARFEWRVANRS